jgi:hypothetical protein
MNEELPTTIKDEEELLQKLRDENAERWKRLNELNQQLCAEQGDDLDDSITTVDEAAKTAAPQLKPRLHDMLQTELDLLPANELAQESNSMLRRILQPNEQDTTTATAADDDDNANDEIRYSMELVESYHELQQTNAILRKSIERERGRLRKMQDWKEQHQRVHETLQTQARHLERTDRDHTEVNEHEPLSNEALQLENQRLKDDFRYVAEYIQKQREPPAPVKSKQSNQQHQPSDELPGRGAVTYWSLDQLIFKLLERLHSSPEDPYLLVDVSPIDTQHVALLFRCHMLETFKDDINMIKLIDYEN